MLGIDGTGPSTQEQSLLIEVCTRLQDVQGFAFLGIPSARAWDSFPVHPVGHRNIARHTSMLDLEPGTVTVDLEPSSNCTGNGNLTCRSESPFRAWGADKCYQDSKRNDKNHGFW